MPIVPNHAIYPHLLANAENTNKKCSLTIWMPIFNKYDLAFSLRNGIRKQLPL
jgi:hypothetical protein